MRKASIVIAGATGAVLIGSQARAEVTLYGLAAVVVTSQNTRNVSDDDDDDIDSDVLITTNPGPQLNSGGAATSRFGIRGTEDLPNGIVASFRFEGAIGLDEGVFEGFDRNAWAGLGSETYGTLRGGLQWTPYDDAYDAIDAQEYASWSAQFVAINNTKGLGNIGSHGDTFSRSNALTYNSPNLAGFNATLMYAVGEDRSEDTSGSSDYQGARLYYLNGPLGVQFAAERQELVDSGNLTIDAYLVGGTFDFGFAKFFGGYQAADGPLGEDEGFSVGLQVPIGSRIVVMTGYARDETTGADGIEVNNGVVEALSVNVNYAFSDSADVFVLATGATASVDLIRHEPQPVSLSTRTGTGAVRTATHASRSSMPGRS